MKIHSLCEDAIAVEYALQPLNTNELASLGALGTLASYRRGLEEWDTEELDRFVGEDTIGAVTMIGIHTVENGGHNNYIHVDFTPTDTSVNLIIFAGIANARGIFQILGPEAEAATINFNVPTTIPTLIIPMGWRMSSNPSRRELVDNWKMISIACSLRTMHLLGIDPNFPSVDEIEHVLGDI